MNLKICVTKNRSLPRKPIHIFVANVKAFINWVEAESVTAV